ncbi:CopG family transcriptional regulator [Corynebacterium sp.]|uniref:CopG family transcriptional regulator n=1 Tax=Corynebacterium sp. TaxID=1720 RepID=UPI0026E040B0|nr:CopG family transcriptional regulator [Corynebacterium sp.]MDO5511495.1 CopG family transcriptional regulator [Corynebacterium sp.]
MAMTLRLTPEQDRALTLLAQAQGSSKHEAAVRAIVAAATRLLNDAAVADIARDIIPGHAALEARIRRSRG